MNRLLERYPELSIELNMSDEVSDLVADGIDLAIRASTIADSSLVARKIGSTRRITVASEACIRAHGLPDHPRDLARLPCLIFTGRPSPNEWQYDGPDGTTMVTVSGRFRSNNSEALRVAVLSGLGYTVMPLWMLGDAIALGQLRPVLAGWEPPAGAISAAYPSRRNLAPRTRAVIDFFVDEFRLDPVISDYGEV
jgi:DNA-binding transcriptional LysR family regulator